MHELRLGICIYGQKGNGRGVRQADDIQMKQWTHEQAEQLSEAAGQVIHLL